MGPAVSWDRVWWQPSLPWVGTQQGQTSWSPLIQVPSASPLGIARLPWVGAQAHGKGDAWLCALIQQLWWEGNQSTSDG